MTKGDTLLLGQYLEKDYVSKIKRENQWMNDWEWIQVKVNMLLDAKEKHKLMKEGSVANVVSEVEVIANGDCQA